MPDLLRVVVDFFHRVAEETILRFIVRSSSTELIHNPCIGGGGDINFIVYVFLVVDVVVHQTNAV